MNITIAAPITFVSGFAYEMACVYWVHYSERNRPGLTALCSMVVALAQVLGIGESIRDWRVASCFVLGYGTGTFTAVKRKGCRHVQQ